MPIPIRILVGEPIEADRLRIADAVQRAGVPLEIVFEGTPDGIEGALENGAFDALVLEYELGENGVTGLIERLFPLIRSMPRIVISASEEQRIAVEAIRCGVHDFLQKSEVFADGRYLYERINQAVAASRSASLDRRRRNRRMRRLRHLATTDPLTGLANRRAVNERMRMTAQGNDRRRHVAVIMFDIDHFKRVNDTFGHTEGDRVIREVGRILRSKAHPTDLVGRMGGEEFIVIRYTQSLCEAWAWAGSVRRAITVEVGLPEPVGGITMSTGVEVVATDDMNEEALLRADRAMYLAKDHDRNRDCTWPMVVAMEAAYAVQTEPGLSHRARLRSIVDRMSTSLGEVQADHTGMHGCDVADLCALIGERLGLAGEDLDELVIAAEFHDIGKVAIPENVLALPRPLTIDERRFTEQHARIGADILRAAGMPERMVDGVREHHDRFDSASTSDPALHLQPSFGQIIAVCDAFAAITSDRTYAPPKSMDHARKVLARERGTQCHPLVTDLLLALTDEEIIERLDGRPAETRDAAPNIGTQTTDAVVTVRPANAAEGIKNAA